MVGHFIRGTFVVFGDVDCSLAVTCGDCKSFYPVSYSTHTYPFLLCILCIILLILA